MVLILDGNSEHVAQASRKISLFGRDRLVCYSSKSNQMPYADKITEFAPYVGMYF